jgi:hypothetical protein
MSTLPLYVWVAVLAGLIGTTTGRIGGAVAAQLLEKGVAIRALVHRDDAQRPSAGLGRRSRPRRCL